MDKDVLYADEMLHKATKKLSFLYINPYNSVTEKDKCFLDPLHNPIFKYKKIRFSLELLKRKLKRLKIPGGPYHHLLSQEKKQCLDKVEMLKYIGDPKFTKYSVRVYGRPSKSLVNKSKELLELPVTKDKKKLTPDKYVAMLENAISLYGLNWKVRRRNGLGSSAYVNVSDKTVLLRRGQHFSENYIQRLIIHEIGTHVLRAENGALQKLKIFESGFPNYITTEEGLAVVNEEIQGLLDNSTLKNYAGRVVAVDMALKHSFSEVYTFLLKYFSRITAYKLAMRVKRGISDTSKPGGCTKDFNYLQGYYAIKKYLSKGGDLKNLYYGKVSLEYVNSVPTFPEIVPPRIFLR